MTLEGSIRNTGTHACGIIIGRKDLHNYVPLANVKESVLDTATQFDGGFIESIGLLKMDFLGLKTLSIIKDTLENVKMSKDTALDSEAIPFDDKETYDLYSRGDTTALFQFESEGMQKYLKELKPSRFEDLIAMNALYRPGPMQYIPEFVERKHGRKEIVYDLPIMEDILKECPEYFPAFIRRGEYQLSIGKVSFGEELLDRGFDYMKDILNEEEFNKVINQFLTKLEDFLRYDLIVKYLNPIIFLKNHRIKKMNHEY